MPHKVKQAREHRRLPHVKEEPDGEEDFQDETFHSGHDAPIRKLTSKYASEGAQKELTGRSETLAMEGRYAKIESSPLPLSRALLSSVVGRKGGPSTPVPSWKMYDNPFQGAMEPANSGENPNLLIRGMAARQSRCPRNSISARKLAASLWEMQGALNPYRGGKDELKSQQHVGLVDSEHHHEGKEGVSQKVVGVGSHQDKAGSSKQPKLSKGLPKSSSSRSPGSPTPYKAELFRRFKEKHPDCKIGMRMFEMLKPFFCRQLKDRYTCCCKYHVQISFLKDTLNHMRSQDFGLHGTCCNCVCSICARGDNIGRGCLASHHTFKGVT